MGLFDLHRDPIRLNQAPIRQVHRGPTSNDMLPKLSNVIVTWQIYVHNLHASYGPIGHMTV